MKTTFVSFAFPPQKAQRRKKRVIPSDLLLVYPRQTRLHANRPPQSRRIGPPGSQTLPRARSSTCSPRRHFPLKRPAYLTAYPPTFLPSSLPISLPSYLPAFLYQTSCLPTSLPTCLSASNCPSAFLLPFLAAYLAAYIPFSTCPFAFLPPFLP